jgi:hypothetical protein
MQITEVHIINVQLKVGFAVKEDAALYTSPAVFCILNYRDLA